MFSSISKKIIGLAHPYCNLLTVFMRKPIILMMKVGRRLIFILCFTTSVLMTACTLDFSLNDNTQGGVIETNPSQVPPVNHCQDYESYIGPTRLFRSVGPNNNLALATGSSNQLTIVDSVAYFNTKPGDQIGIGDVIEYDSSDDGSVDSLAFIHCRKNEKEFILKQADGSNVPDLTEDTDWSIFRAYTSLADAESGTPNPSITMDFHSDSNWNVGVGRDLVTPDETWNIACYGDGIDSGSVSINGWTTSATNTIKIFTPKDPSEVGVSQRHNGAWTLSGVYQIGDGSTHSYVIEIQSEYVHIEGLQIFAANFGNDWCLIILAQNSLVTGNFLRAPVQTGGHAPLAFYGSGINATTNHYFINNIGYGGQGITNRHRLYAYNNTIIESDVAGLSIDLGSGTLIAKNNLIKPMTGEPAFLGTLHADSDYNASSEGTTTGGSGGNDRINQIFDFVDEASLDFRLKPTDTGALTHGMDLSLDPIFAFSVDINNNLRDSTWDIGAHQL